MFRVRALAGFDQPQGFTAVSPVPHGGIAAYRFGPVSLAAGAETEVTAAADGPVPDNVLPCAGDFRAVTPSVEIVNVTPSTGSFIPSDGERRLGQNPLAKPRQYFAVAGASVDPALLKP